MTPSLSSNRRPTAPLYTPAERARRDATRWTLVQGVLAPVQFVVFAVSLGLVLRTLSTGEGETAASISVVVKTAVLYTDHGHRRDLGEATCSAAYLFAPPLLLGGRGQHGA